MKKKIEPKKPAKKQDQQKLHEELSAELGALRTNLKDITSRFQANIETQIVVCMNTLSDNQTDELSAICQDENRLQELLLVVRNLSLKPKKGRLKDLRRIQTAIDELYSHLSQS